MHYGNTTINYSVIKTKRRKTSEIIVDKDTVEIRTPFDKPDHEIRNIVKDKANWILKKQKEYREMNPEIMKPTFEDEFNFAISWQELSFKNIYKRSNETV